MPKRATEIPVGTQFSPNLIDLSSFLGALVANEGNREALQAAVWSPPVHLKAPHGIPASRRRANLPLEAASQYGLLERGTLDLTQTARMLAPLTVPELYEEFARHILLRCGGLRVVDATQQMRADGMHITGDSLCEYLNDQGFFVGIHNTAINTLRMWLAKVDVFIGRGWEVNPKAKEQILGLSDTDLGVLGQLNEEQTAFTNALVRLNPQGWVNAADVRALAEAATGLRMSRSSLPQQFLEPLRQAGLIEYETAGTVSGKSTKLRTTNRFQVEVLKPFLSTTLKTMDAALAAYFNRRPEDIYGDLSSQDTFRKGQALEAFAIHIMRLMGLRFVEWRKRAAETTGRAEVDALLTGTFGAVATRWQVQCKNTPSGRVELEDVAKEIGLLPLTRATHVMIIANCPITADARRFAEQINRQTTSTVFLLDKKEFDSVKANAASLGPILRQKAEEITHQQPPGWK